jgi:hypothetical protein
MKYRKWDPKTKAQVVLEGLENKVPLALAVQPLSDNPEYVLWLERPTFS